MQRIRMGSRAVIAALAVGSLTLTSACGLNSSSSSDETGGASAPQGVKGKVITVGSNAVLSGPAAAYGVASTAAEHYFDHINETGGINGYTFKFVQRDNAYSGAQAITVARQLATTDKVFAMITTGTIPGAAVIPLASTLKVPIIAMNDGGLFPEKAEPNLYGIAPKYSRIAKGNARFAIEDLKITDLAYAYQDDDFGQPGAKALPEYVPANGGKLLASVGFPAAETNFNPIANKLKTAGAKAVLVGAGPTQLAGLQKAARAIGYKPTWVAMFTGVTPAYLKLAGPLAEGTFFDSYLDSSANTGPGMELFTKTLAKYPDEMGILGQSGWQVSALITKGVELATAGDKPLTTQGFEDALNSLKGQRVALWSDVSWTDEAHTGATSEHMVQVKDGKFVVAKESTPLPE